MVDQLATLRAAQADGSYIALVAPRIVQAGTIRAKTGAALVGVELSSREGYEPLWKRMEASPLTIQLVAPGSTAYRFLV